MRIAWFLAVLALVLGCVDEQLDNAELADSVMLGEREPTPVAKLANLRCDLEAQLAYRVGGRAEVECGEVRSGAQVLDAVRCVLDASAAKRTFALIVATDSSHRSAYAGGPRLHAVITSDGAVLRTATCDALALRPGCTPSASDLCLYCPAPIELSAECAVVTNDACNEPGNYSDAMPCCPGLRAVAQRSKVFGDDSLGSCVDGPLQLHACIEGSCGDGRCEPEEAVACGCALDCPVAED
jgi:hypothetical protein